MRYFVAIRVDARPKIVDILTKLSKFEGVKAVEPENLHINLKFLGEVSDRELEKIKESLGAVRGFGSFTTQLSGVRAFPNNSKINVLWIGAHSDKLVGLMELIDLELNKLGFEREREYKPHVTLARVHRKISEIGAFLGAYDFGELEIRHIELIKSELGGNGPKYKTMVKVEL